MMATREVEPIKVSIKRRVFNEVYFPYLNNRSRTQIFFGGSSSGKSVFLSQRCVIHILGGGHNYLICRAVASTIKHSVFQEVKKVIANWGLLAEFKINESDMTITCKNGHQILFSGLDDVEKMKSVTPQRGAITDVWIEEATEVQADDIKQLELRQRGKSDIDKTITLSFNPILRSHHLFAKYFNPVGWTDDQISYISQDSSLSILRTWFEHNRFLTEQDKQNILGITDPYFADVYAWGKFGVLGDVIFTNWIVADLDDPAGEFYLPVSQRTNRRNGLDFGFSADPAALPVTHYDRMRKHIYIYSELYERGLTNDVLADEAKKLIGNWYILDKNGKLLEANSWQEAEEFKDEDGYQILCKSTDYVTCDSAEPKSILELQRLGVNAIPAKKGKDSINHGIDWLKRQKIIIDKKCVNSQLEFQQYQWKKDKDGNSMKVPVDKNNHVIDALRYGYENDMDEIDYSKVLDSV